MDMRDPNYSGTQRVIPIVWNEELLTFERMTQLKAYVENATFITEVDELEAKLDQAVEALNSAVEALVAIRDTDGIKKIVDAVTVSGSIDVGNIPSDYFKDGESVDVIRKTLVKDTVTANQVGNNSVYTPAEGKKVRLLFFGYSAGANVEGVLVGMRFGAAGDVFDNQYLIAAGQPYARNMEAGGRYKEGAIGETLYVNLSAAQTVYVNFEVEEV